ncbi:MAG: hypothetical protein C0P74_008460 [Gammaproteobacteria bacterium]|nr:hypothetical protein [Gammaproteobacteria bacterium]
MRAISIKAVLLATLAVLGVDFLLGMVLIGLFAPELNSAMTDEQVRQTVERLLNDREYLLLSFVFGTGTTVLGGYLAARLGRIVPYFHALAFGLLSIVLGLLTAAQIPTWYHTVGILITVPAALVGAHIAKRQAHRIGNG